MIYDRLPTGITISRDGVKPGTEGEKRTGLLVFVNASVTSSLDPKKPEMVIYANMGRYSREITYFRKSPLITGNYDGGNAGI